MQPSSISASQSLHLTPPRNTSALMSNNFSAQSTLLTIQYQKSSKNPILYYCTHSMTMPESMYRCNSVSSFAKICFYLSSIMCKSTRISAISPSSRNISNIRVAISTGVR